MSILGKHSLDGQNEVNLSAGVCFGPKRRIDNMWLQLGSCGVWQRDFVHSGVLIDATNRPQSINLNRNLSPVQRHASAGD